MSEFQSRTGRVLDCETSQPERKKRRSKSGRRIFRVLTLIAFTAKSQPSDTWNSRRNVRNERFLGNLPRLDTVRRLGLVGVGVASFFSKSALKRLEETTGELFFTCDYVLLKWIFVFLYSTASALMREARFFDEIPNEEPHLTSNMIQRSTLTYFFRVCQR